MAQDSSHLSRFSMANRDISFLQEQNQELQNAVKVQTAYAEEKANELSVAERKLAELQAAFEKDKNEIDMIKKLYAQRYEIKFDQCDV